MLLFPSLIRVSFVMTLFVWLAVGDPESQDRKSVV